MRTILLVITLLIACGLAQGKGPMVDTVRDHLWIWAHPAGSHNNGWGLEKKSRMTPVEGAVYMGIPNIMFISYGGKPSLDEFETYAISFRPMKQIIWSVTGASDGKSIANQPEVLDIAKRFPNITGFMMDDFFTGNGSAWATPEGLAQFRQEIAKVGRPLALWAVLYNNQLDMKVQEHLKQCDGISFWTWKAEDISKLKENFEKTEKIAPNCRKILGLYMWDYGTQKPMPIERMKQQCELGLKWLKEGRIEGMVFLASNICDLNLETVEWTREWIKKVGNEPIK
ncbi:MAG: hypothetical protein WCO51_00325 [bacterium]